MDYRIFQRDNNFPIHLSTQEIEQPFLTLQTLLAGTSHEELQHDLENLVHAVIKQEKWREYGAPVYLYEVGERLLKLMDVLWLIDACYRKNDIRPQLTYEERSLMHQFHKRSFKNLFRDTPTDIDDIPKEDPYLILAEFCNECSLVSWRATIYIWLKTALSASYMETLNLNFYDVSDGFVRAYRVISSIITAGCQLKSLKTTSDAEHRLNLYRIFAHDIDHPDTLEEMEIDNPLCTLDCPYYYMNVASVPNAIKIWYGMLASENHWQHHNDPGNVLFLKETVVQQMEAAWMLLRNSGKMLNTLRCGHGKINTALFTHLTIEEQTTPFRVIEDFFSNRSLSEWKLLISDWTRGSLTDRKEEELIHSRLPGQTCDQLIKLMKALSVIDERWQSISGSTADN